jgi:hypothetical protein
MMFIGKLVQVKSRDINKLYGIIYYVDNNFIVKVNGEYIGLFIDWEGVNTLYSLPVNDKYEAWTKKSVSGVKNVEIVSKFWSPYKQGMKVHGEIIERDGNKQFKVL